MSAYYRGSDDVIDYTPGSAVSAGDVVVLGDTVCVATADIAANVRGQLHVRGLFQFPKSSASTSAIVQGTIVYWDAGNEVITSTASTHKRAGKLAVAADADDVNCRVLLGA